MNHFIENVNKYITHYGIKQSFISGKSGIEKNKLSRLLNQQQDIASADMGKIAFVLKKEISYFIDGTIELNPMKYAESTSIAFYMGTPTKENQETASLVFEFLENIDAILGVKDKIKAHTQEVL